MGGWLGWWEGMSVRVFRCYFSFAFGRTLVLVVGSFGVSFGYLQDGDERIYWTVHVREGFRGRG